MPNLLRNSDPLSVIISDGVDFIEVASIGISRGGSGL
jgi:hypothetical protein